MGSPKITIIASPMNLLMIPLYFVIIGSISAKYSFKILETSTACIFSLMLVKPLISENRTVTTVLLPPSPRLSMFLTTFFITS